MHVFLFVKKKKFEEQKREGGGGREYKYENEMNLS